MNLNTLMNIPDKLMYKAVDYSVRTKASSVSMIEDELGCGYATAAMIINEMEHLGILGDYREGKPRRVLMTAGQWEKILSVS